MYRDGEVLSWQDGTQVERNGTDRPHRSGSWCWKRPSALRRVEGFIETEIGYGMRTDNFIWIKSMIELTLG